MNRFTVEIAGVPASGKTTAAHRLRARLLRERQEAFVVREAAEVAPFPRSYKTDWRFNAWTLFHVVSEMIRLHADPSAPSVILDRGLFDSAAWVRWHLSSKRLDKKTASLLESVCFLEMWQREVDAVFLLEASFEVVLERRQGRIGQIVNRQTFGELAEAYASIRTDEEVNLTMPVFVIPTDHRSPDEVENVIFKLVMQIAAKRKVVAAVKPSDES